MFDSLFALAFLLIITVLIAAVVFLTTRNRLHLRSGVWLALGISVGGLIGFCGSTKLNYELSPARFLDETPLMRFGISLMSGIVLAGLFGWLTWRTSFNKR